jgi:hypothetical protein
MMQYENLIGAALDIHFQNPIGPTFNDPVGQESRVRDPLDLNLVSNPSP